MDDIKEFYEKSLTASTGGTKKPSYVDEDDLLEEYEAVDSDDGYGDIDDGGSDGDAGEGDTDEDVED